MFLSVLFLGMCNPVSLHAAEPAAVFVLDEEHELPLARCHFGDLVIVHIESIPPSAEGWLFTTNTTLVLEKLSMVRTVTNRFTFQIVCDGLTSAPTVKTVVLRRPPPVPIVTIKRLIPREIPPPPSPAGMISRVSMPLPLPPEIPRGEDYGQFQERMKKAQMEGRRRSQ